MPRNGIAIEEAAAFLAASEKYMPPSPCDDMTCVNVVRIGEWARYTTFALCQLCASRAPDVFKLGMTYNPPEWSQKLSKADELSMKKARKTRSVTYLVVRCLRERARENESQVV